MRNLAAFSGCYYRGVLATAHPKLPVFQTQTKPV
jgi:hypothetical protein